MALLHFDGFDDYYTASGTTNRSAFLLGEYSSPGGVTVETMPILGTLGFRCSAGRPNNGALSWEFPGGDSTSRTFGVGFHFYASEWRSNHVIVGFRSASGTQRYSLRVNDSGALTLYSGTGGGSAIGTVSGLSTSTLYHIEIKVVQHGSTGSIEVRLNGATAILASDLNTAVTIGQLLFIYEISSQNGNAYYIDNLYVWDNTGAVNNDWLGERLVYTLMPDGDGPTQDWTLSTGSDTYALLDNIPSDPDTEYIESSAADDIAQVTLSELPSIDILPIAVKTHFRGMKTGTSTIEVGVAPAGETPVAHPMTQDQSLYFGTIYELNPDTGQEWTPGEINSLTLDIKRVT